MRISSLLALAGLLVFNSAAFAASHTATASGFGKSRDWRWCEINTESLAAAAADTATSSVIDLGLPTVNANSSGAWVRPITLCIYTSTAAVDSVQVELQFSHDNDGPWCVTNSLATQSGDPSSGIFVNFNQTTVPYRFMKVLLCNKDASTAGSFSTQLYWLR